MADFFSRSLQTMARKLQTKRHERRTRLERQKRRGMSVESLECRRLMVGDISGTVFDDANRNGINDPAENGLPGWTVFVDDNGDGLFTAGEPSATTDTKGKFLITGVPAGNVSLYEVVESGWSPTPGFTDHQTVQVRDGREVRAKFPNVTAPITTGRVSGSIFEDNNENGVDDPGEHGISGWTVFVDTNLDGLFTAGEPTSVSDADGNYSITGVPAGAARVYEVPLGGLQPTVGGLFPLDGALPYRDVTIVAGGSTRLDFGNLIPQVGTIQGTVWNDTNGDGSQTAGETAAANRTVFLDLNANGTPDVGEPSRLTDANGQYSFVNIHTGTYGVTEILPEGWITATGRPSVVTRTVAVNGLYVVDYYNLIPVAGTVSGTVWNDVNANAAIGAGELGLGGWTVYIDKNSNGLLDATEPQTTTADDGSYSITNVNYGFETIRTILPANWEATNSASGAITIHLLNGEDRTGVNLGAREKIGTIQGTVWNDANGDRLRGATEAGLADWTVYIDLNQDGIQQASEPSALTDAAGAYQFTRVPSGGYWVREVVPAGWINSIGKASSIFTNVTTNGTSTDDFYNLVPVAGSVSGVLFSDVDSNGAQGAFEPGLEGWTVYIDANLNGSLDAGERSVSTDATGAYTIADVPYGDVSLREVAQGGFTLTNPVTGRYAFTLLNGENRSLMNFANHDTNVYSISGSAFYDANANGVRDVGERGLSGLPVYIDMNVNGVQDPGEPSTTTSADLFFTPAVDETGNYTFTHLTRGTYHVREIVTPDLEATPAAARELVVTVGPSQTGADFANLFRSNEIHGIVFDDSDSDGVQDPGELPRTDVAVYLDLDRDNVFDVDEPETISAADGSYVFASLTPGAYVVREKPGEYGPLTYPTTGGGVYWPAGTSHSSVGNVSHTGITISLSQGEVYRDTYSITLPPDFLTNMADVFLLFDDTGSFTGNSPIVRAAFPQIMSSLQTALPGMDLGFGVGRFEEYANFAAEFATGRPFILNQPIVAASTPGMSTAIQAALDRTAPGYGGDQPETDIEALYQLVTGVGFDGNNNGTVSDSGAAGLANTQLNPGASGDVPSFASFTPDPANNVLPADGNVGGGGFRAGALPIILLATDTGFAYQPKGETTITGVSGTSLPVSALTQTSRGTTPFSSGAGLQETVTALNALGALVIGLGTNQGATVDPRQGLESLATLTGSINRSDVTIDNGTIDPIAPGDPMYFQITTGFASTVSSGVINAIQNAIRNTALDITVRASDPRVKLVNHTGTVTGVGAGQTASFDVEFTGDGRPHRFDLQFVRAGTNVVLGSIPVTIGTPVAGEGYHFVELEDGQIDDSAHFGHYHENVAPSFTGGVDQSVLEDAGSQTIVGWATDISAGPASEIAQVVDFQVANDNPSLFSVAPAISPDGTLTFTPAPNANGSAVVTVRLHDNGGVGLSGADTSAAQTFVISVAPVNDAPVVVDDAYSVDEESTLTVAAPGVSSNDSDVEGDPLTVAVVSGPAHGSVTLNADGSFDYIPEAGFFGADSFTYQANDGSATSNVGTVSISVNRINHAPVAVDDSYATSEDVTLDGALPGVLANDSDLEGDALTVALVTGPAHGSVTLNADGSFQYVPAANFNGVDQFTYQSSDGTLTSNIATVTISVAAVNDAPVAVTNSYSLNEDTTLNVAAPGVLGNDSDVDGDSLSARIVANVAHGALTFNANGSFQYVPDANFFGADSFSYVANDGVADSAPVTVTLSVAAVNDAPVAADNTYAVNEDTTLSVAAPGVLGNDFDVEGSALTATRLTNPAHGSLSFSANGSFVYTPAANYNGPDSFTYRVSDGLLNSNVATVTINVAAVNDLPAPTADSYSTNRNQTLTIAAPGVLVNDTDADGDPMTALLGATPTNGSITLNANGSFTYVPALNFSGTDSFTYRVSDGTGVSGFASVTITVIPPPPPSTKFFVVDQDRAASFQYAADGSSISNGALNKSDSKPRGIASNATGTTQWVVDGSGTVFVYDNSGLLLGQWQPQNVGKPEGITVWGNDLWLVDPNQDRVFAFTGGAAIRSGRVSPTSSFALNAGNLSSTDLVTDGSHIWVVDDTLAADKVFRYSTTGVLQGSWTLPTTNPSPTGITLDPTNVNHLWVVDASTDKVYQYDGATARLSGTQAASVTFALAATNTNAQGIADPAPLTGLSSTIAMAAASSTSSGGGSSNRGSAASDDSRPATVVEVRHQALDAVISSKRHESLEELAKHVAKRHESSHDVLDSVFADL